MWGIAGVKQGSALLLSGWVTACVMFGWHLSGLGEVASNCIRSDNWIDFHDQGLTNETLSAGNMGARVPWYNCMVPFNILASFLVSNF